MNEEPLITGQVKAVTASLRPSELKKIHVERRVLLQAYTGAIINYQLLIFTPGSSIHTSGP